ncbi:MAG: hypothetical protein ACYS26_07140 [Planctomycetota bacterium]|jgi:hypothetical protein
MISVDHKALVLVSLVLFFFASGATAQGNCSGCTKSAPGIATSNFGAASLSITLTNSVDGSCDEECLFETPCTYEYDLVISGIDGSWEITDSSQTANVFDGIDEDKWRDGSPSPATNGTFSKIVDVACGLVVGRMHTIERTIVGQEGVMVGVITMECSLCTSVGQ